VDKNFLIFPKVLAFRQKMACKIQIIINGNLAASILGWGVLFKASH
jgi:hypothetical protein